MRPDESPILTRRDRYFFALMGLLYTLDVASSFFGPKHYRAGTITGVRYANELVVYTPHGDYLNMLVCKGDIPSGSYEIDISGNHVEITKNPILNLDAASCELSNRMF